MSSGKPSRRLTNPARRAALAAFTLIEVLAVVAIIALLLAVLLPSLKRARDQARTVACASNLRITAQAMYFYTQSNSGYFPNSGAWAEAAHGYILRFSRGETDTTIVYGDRPVQDIEVFQCPADVIKAESAEGCASYRGEWESYVYRISYLFNPFLPFRSEPVTMGGQRVYIITPATQYEAGTYYDACENRYKQRYRLKKTDHVKRPADIVMFTDAGDDDNCGHDPLEALRWDFDDAIDINFATDPPVLEVHHVTGNNFAYVDQHVEFKSILRRTGPHETLGVPLFPYRWVPEAQSTTFIP